MINRDSLDRAVSKGILTADTAQNLYDFLLSEQREATPSADFEDVRFVRGFHDVFISAGLVILIVGLLTGGYALEMANLVIFGGVAAVSWGLAEWLANKQRLALPSIVLSLSFAIFAGLSLSVLLRAALFAPDFWAWINGSTSRLIILDTPEEIWTAGAGALLGSALFYARFGVPIALAQCLLAIIVMAYGFLEDGLGSVSDGQLQVFVLVAGFASFLVAMFYDSRDPKRQTLSADKGFWLHLVAAPLIAHGLLATFSENLQSSGEALIMIFMVLLLGVVALIVDRRALLISGLGYMGVAIFTLLQAVSVDEKVLIAAAMLILGLFVLSIGSGWPLARKWIMKPLAGTPIAAIVPPTRK